METFALWLSNRNMDNPILLGLLGGIFIALLNLLGACLVFPFKKVSQKFLDTSLGFAAGVMLTASFTSLILPGIQYGGIFPVLIGIVLGTLVIDLGDHFIPHRHFIRGREGVE